MGRLRSSSSDNGIAAARLPRSVSCCMRKCLAPRYIRSSTGVAAVSVSPIQRMNESDRDRVGMDIIKMPRQVNCLAITSIAYTR